MHRAAFLVLLTFPLLATAGPDEKKQPALIYHLVVDGKAHKLLANVPTTLPVEAGKPTVVLKPAPTRTFTYFGLSMEYPAAFGWEADVSADFSSWTMSGEDTKIMIFRQPKSETPLVDFADAVTERFGKAKCKRKQIELKLGGKALKGLRIVIDIAGELITQDVFALPHAKFGRLLILQDGLDEDNKPSAEYRYVTGLLEAKLKWK